MAARGIEIDRCFAAGYEAARATFLAAAEAAGADLVSFRHPAPGPRGEALATDVAWLGPADAEHVLVLVAGTHGVEGLAGSGLLTAQLRSGLLRAARGDLAVVLVHALNPHGFAALRRVNEENVDVNRNFVDFPVGFRNTAYDDLHDCLLLPPTRLGRLQRRLAISAYAARNGRRRLQQAVTMGQFAHPAGLFFGGGGPSWSHSTWERIVARLIERRRVLVIDYHTGLGTRGHGQLITPLFPTPTLSAREWRARAMTACFGAAGFRNIHAGNAVATPVAGDLLSYTMARGDNLAAVVLEFGTYRGLTVLEALIDENWAHQAADPADPEARRHRERLVEVFAPRDPAWRRAIYHRAAEMTAAAIAGLCRE